MSLPPDLRVVCRKLAAAAPADLPALCPVLVGHILRCGAVLSAPAEPARKAAAGASEAAVLVHKLKTHVHALLHGRTAAARLAGVVLAKAVLDVGGWACLRTAESWVRGMLSILQKPDPYAAKELCVAILARIYTLLQAYPTLVREMATPTVPAFATACLQLLRPGGGGGAAAAPPSVAETATRALAALVPLYPTTLRPFAAPIRAAIRGYLAPTASDPGPTVVPSSLRQSARRLLVLLPYTAPKNGSADEWTRLLRSLLRQAHATADQVFRAVRESRDPRSGSSSEPVSCEGPPRGGGDDGDNTTTDDITLPAWTGLPSGAERLQGLLCTIAAFFCGPTKLPVAVPLGAVADLVARLSMVLPPADFSAGSSLFNPSIGRDERDDLWTMLPAVHLAALALLAAAVRRLGVHALPLAPVLLDDALRLFAATRAAAAPRAVAYDLLRDLLPRMGPALPRAAVDALVPAVHACCADLLVGRAGGASPEPTEQNGSGGARKGANTTNADLFLVAAAATDGGPSGSPSGTGLPASHTRAAEAFLACVLRHVPPQHVKKADRARMDRTAILCASKPAMVASVLQPYVDAGGRAFANTIPFLARAFPHDVEVEVLRSNLRVAPHVYGDVFAAMAPGESEGDEGDDEEEEMAEEGSPASSVSETLPNRTAPATGGFALPAAAFDAPAAAPALVARTQPQPVTTPTPPTPSSLKRKPDDEDPASVRASNAAKRIDTGKAPAAVDAVAPAVAPAVTAPAEDDAPLPDFVPATAAPAADEEAGDDSGDESDGSVQLEMVFAEEEDDDDEEET